MNEPLFAIAMGLVSAACFYAVAVLHLGVMFMMLPGLPIFYAGLTRSAYAMLVATLASAALVGFMSGLPGVVFFLLFSAIPPLLLARRAVLCRQTGSAREWFPLGLAFVDLVTAMALLVVGLCLYYASQGGLSQALQAQLAENIRDMEPQVQEVLLNLSSSVALIVIAASLWMWLLLALLTGWMAQKLAQRRGRALRPDFALTPFAMPRWMLGALILSAMASLAGSEAIAFAGKVSLMLWLFPYFLLGMGLIHARAADWPNRGFVLFMIYFFLLAQAWPALLVAGYGVWHQCAALTSSSDSST